MIGPAVPVRSEESFSWLAGGYFPVQPYETTFGEEPTQEGINYWYYDSEAERFRIIVFSNNGPSTEDGNRYEGEVASGKLTFRSGPVPIRTRSGRADQGESGWHDLSGLVVARRARRMAAVDERHVHEGPAMIAVPRGT